MTALDARIRARLDLVRQHMTDETANPLDGVSRLWNDAGELASAVLAVLDLHKRDVDDDGDPVCWKCRGRGDDWPDEWPCETVRALAQNLGIEDA